MTLPARSALSALALIASLLFAAPAAAQEAPAPDPPSGWNPDSGVYEMRFPIDGPNSYGDTWGACRDGCSRSHEGTDIFGKKMTPVVAVADGTVGWMHDTQGGKCCAMALNHDDGWASWYIHLNNDTPGTDDGQGWGFAPGITSGVHVEAGQLIGYVGDSGNAENTSSHVHFELHRPDGTKINPYAHLRAAEGGNAAPGIVTLESYRVDDGPQHDGTGNDSKGNNDGFAQCGETIEFYVTVANGGESALTNLSAKLAESDPYVGLLYNTGSSYPDIAAGESAENPRDWDLRVSGDTPGGHLFKATITYTANYGGPWTIDLSVPIVCGEDVTRPVVDSVTPPNAALAVERSDNITVIFSEPVDPATVTTETFTLENGGKVAGAFTVAGDAMSATFDPESDLGEHTAYTVTLTSGIVDEAGNSLVPFISWFSTTDVRPGTILYVAQRIDDGPSHDGTGNDSKGNNDGRAQCGETIELYLTVRNEGTFGLSGLAGRIDEDDPYARLLFNNNSPFPEIGVGEEEENEADWDLRIASETPNGYELTVTITFFLLDPVSLSLRPAHNSLDLRIPVSCPPPKVTGVDPADGAADESIDSAVNVSFSKAVDPATVTTDTFRVDNGSPVSGTVAVAGNGRSATFTPDAALAFSTEHTVTMTGGITDAHGNPLVEFVSGFTTEYPDLTAPEVAVVAPRDGAGLVSIGSNVVVTFTEPVAPGSVTGETFRVNDGAVTGTISVSGDGTKATFDPDSDLAYVTTYSVMMTGGVADPAGNPLVPFASSFTTMPEPPPQGTPVVLSYRVDDGPSHDGTGNDSKGNNDGRAQCGETIEIYITVRNDGGTTLRSLSGKLAESDPYVTLLYNSSSSYPDLAPGVASENPRDWDFRIASSTPLGHEFKFTVTYSADGAGPWQREVKVPIGCAGSEPPPPPGLPVVVSYRVDDGPSHDGTGNDSKGNNDGRAQCGETIELYVTIRNDGEGTLRGLKATLQESDPYVGLLYNTSSGYADIPVGASAENPRDWDLKVNTGAPDGYEFTFTLTFTADNGGPWKTDVSVPIACGG
jgi:predicted SnoaL-like aldol condensation-catalyzing enzyme